MHFLDAHHIGDHKMLFQQFFIIIIKQVCMPKAAQWKQEQYLRACGKEERLTYSNKSAIRRPCNAVDPVSRVGESQQHGVCIFRDGFWKVTRLGVQMGSSLVIRPTRCISWWLSRWLS